MRREVQPFGNLGDGQFLAMEQADDFVKRKTVYPPRCRPPAHFLADFCEVVRSDAEAGSVVFEVAVSNV